MIELNGIPAHPKIAKQELNARIGAINAAIVRGN